MTSHGETPRPSHLPEFNRHMHDAGALHGWLTELLLQKGSGSVQHDAQYYSLQIEGHDTEVVRISNYLTRLVHRDYLVDTDNPATPQRASLLRGDAVIDISFLNADYPAHYACFKPRDIVRSRAFMMDVSPELLGDLPPNQYVLIGPEGVTPMDDDIAHFLARWVRYEVEAA